MLRGCYEEVNEGTAPVEFSLNGYGDAVISKRHTRCALKPKFLESGFLARILVTSSPTRRHAREDVTRKMLPLNFSRSQMNSSFVSRVKTTKVTVAMQFVEKEQEDSRMQVTVSMSPQVQTTQTTAGCIFGQTFSVPLVYQRVQRVTLALFHHLADNFRRRPRASIHNAPLRSQPV